MICQTEGCTNKAVDTVKQKGYTFQLCGICLSNKPILRKPFPYTGLR